MSRELQLHLEKEMVDPCKKGRKRYYLLLLNSIINYGWVADNTISNIYSLVSQEPKLSSLSADRSIA